MPKILLRDRLRQERERQSLTQPELAARIGVTVFTICRLETGKQFVTTDLLRRISNALDGALDDAVIERQRFDEVVESRRRDFWVDPPTSQAKRKRA